MIRVSLNDAFLARYISQCPTRKQCHMKVVDIMDWKKTDLDLGVLCSKLWVRYFYFVIPISLKNVVTFYVPNGVNVRFVHHVPGAYHTFQNSLQSLDPQSDQQVLLNLLKGVHVIRITHEGPFMWKASQSQWSVCIHNSYPPFLIHCAVIV